MRLFAGSRKRTKTLKQALAIVGLFFTVVGIPNFVAAQEDLPAKLVADLHGAFGMHHARAIHAKGIVLMGSFEPSSEAILISKAKLFKAPSSIIVRFSDFTGLPEIPDNVGDANPRGMAIKFGTIEDSPLDIVAHSFNGFPVSNAVDFGRLFQAIAASGPNAAKPTQFDNFLATHPVAKTFLTSQRSPASFTTASYFGVNAFRFVNTNDQKVAIRYRFVPAAGEKYLDAAELKTAPADYLMRDVTERVHKAPILFGWYAQIAEPGDDLEDPAKAWPETRRLVKLGTIRIEQIASDQADYDKRLIFLPGNVPDGIEAADPMIGVRSAAYPVSFGERQ